jgi:SPW repeat-containing protein
MEKAQTNLRTASIINIVLGAWLIASPFLLGYAATQSFWNQTIAGILIGCLGLWRLLDVTARWSRWVTIAAGTWLIVAPYVLNYSKMVAYWNELLAAVIVGILAIDIAATPDDQPHPTRRRMV